jgi:fucose 4-O-acetylase-like acetyltransferase
LNKTDANPPPLVKVLAILLFIFGLFAFFGSLFLWGEGFLLDAPPGVDIAFPVTDILVNAPACLITSYGLWKLKSFGYPASQFTAGFFIYASVYIFVEVLQGGPPYPLEILLPQALAVATAIVLVFYLYRVRDLFHN